MTDGSPGPQPPMRRLAVLSLHTSPLAQPGTGDSGGMNVYVRELVSSLAQAGCRSRRVRPPLGRRPARRGRRRARVPGRPRRRRVRSTSPRRSCPTSSTTFTDGVARPPRPARATSTPCTPTTGCRASPATGSSTSSTCRSCRRSTRSPGSRPRPATPSPSGACEPRPRSSAARDAILAVVRAEADAARAALRRRPRAHRDRAARRRPRLLLARRPSGARPRSAPRASATARCSCSSAASSRSRASTSPSGPWPSWTAAGRHAGRRRRPERHRRRAPRSTRIQQLVDDLGVADQVRFVPPQPHHLLSTYYRAADVCLVPSRSESFGLVALEAAACGTPVVAAAVGGLRTLVDHGRTGFLVEGRDPADFAAARRPRSSTTPALAAGPRQRPPPSERRDYTWSTTAGAAAPALRRPHRPRPRRLR